MPKTKHNKFTAIEDQYSLSHFKVAIIDDDPEIQVFLETLFKEEGFSISSFLNAKTALQATEGHWDLILCDLKLPDMDGLELIQKLKESRSDTPIILITAHGSVELAINALQNGAFDFVTKPINPLELSIIAKRAIHIQRLQSEYLLLRKQIESTYRFGSIIGKSHKMQQIFTLIERVAKTSANILITGESGTGKEMVARTIHEKSTRNKSPFVAINCSAIPENLLESEFFGHKRGAFTGASENRIGLFEEAQGGTIFLDEIGDMSLALQAKLLRVLQERKVKPVGSNEFIPIDVRVIAATHKDLKMGIQDKSFREDLYYRLCVVQIQIPALRERSEDIVPLAEGFLAKYSQMNGVRIKKLSRAALTKIVRMEWKGNVRELENAIERAVVLTESDIIDDSAIRSEFFLSSGTKIRELFEKLPTLKQLEKEYISFVLGEAENHKEKAAEILGINRKTLYRKESENKKQSS